MKKASFFVRLLFALPLIGLLASCATGDPDRESDLPWNTPQQWEGAPGIPGFGGDGY